jgi:hypothetical protein
MQEYSGKWSSGKYSALFSRGNVTVHLPEKMDQKVVVQAKIKYLGMYRLGQEETIPIMIDGKDEIESQFITPTDAVKQAMKHNQETEKKKVSPDMLSKEKVEGLLTFKVLKRKDDEISGSYTLSQPEDQGTFELKKGPNHGENCIIM